MSNFTKSIVYSGVVLAAGLIAIFAIYNNMSGSEMSGIEPAAGTEAAGAYSDSFEGVTDSVQQASEDAMHAAEGAMEATGEAVSEGVDHAVDAVEDATGMDSTVTEPASAEEPVEGTVDGAMAPADDAEKAADDAEHTE